MTKEPRLRFTDEERADPAMEKPIRKADKAAAKADKAQAKIPKKQVRQKTVDPETGKVTTKLVLEDKKKPPSKLSHAVRDTPANAALGKVHKEIRETEQDNVGVESAHKSEEAAETGARLVREGYRSHKLKPYRKAAQAEQKLEKANVNALYQKSLRENPQLASNPISRWQQKQAIKKEYAAARKAGSQTAGTATKKTGKKTREKAADKVKEFFAKNKKVFLWIGVGLMILVLLAAGISSCTAMFSSTGSAVIASSYLSEDEAMLGAEAQYCQMEAELQDKLDNFESYYPGYDEYNYDLDGIEHDPYVLISILSALHEAEFTLSEVQSTLQMLFDKQYILTTEEIVEVRYRTETRVGSYTTTDPETGATTTHYYTYEVEVPYNYYIMNVTLENFNLSHVPVYIMSQDQLSMYATYMSVLGNREDLFPDSPYVDKYIENPPDEYTVNPSYMSDETFSTLIEEAEKYLNYPYVWGGSNPETSFDCSGFVSYVLTNSGLVNTGRLGAQGLYNVCTPVSRADAKPGDLVFFVGTYDTPGVSHVGIYVGDGVMLHCGDPIQYSSINTSYWQSHFYAFGRPNY